jgi:chitinase
MWPTWPPAAAPQAAAGAEPASAVCGRVVLTEQEITMSLRNVIYYNAGNDKIPLGVGLNQLPYTDVIVANLQPTSATDRTLIGWGNAFDKELQNNIRWLQRANKYVLISFGGGSNDKLTTAAYQYYADNVTALVNQIVAFVKYYNFNGVDIDYEDSAGFGEHPAYDGVGFLSALTSGLYQALPVSTRVGDLVQPQNIITHAPQTPYWDSHSIYARGGTPPYWHIWKNAGSKIAWINNQFYSNDANDKPAALKVEKYRAVAGLIGAQKLLMGVSLGGAEGAETLSDMVHNVIPPLKAQYGSQFGGVMGWQFSQDHGGAWANGISQALGPGGGP